MSKWIVIMAVVGVLVGAGLGLVAPKKPEAKTERPIVGLVLPHHDLARELVISALERIPGQYKLIVLFAPNHFRPTGPAITTAEKLDGLAIDAELVTKITKAMPEILTDDELLAGEHGVKIPAGYLVHYFPEAKIVPLVFSGKASPEEIERLADRLLEIVPTVGTLWVTSVDFAHDQTSLAGLANNQETIETIATRDYQKLFTYGDEHLDSPAAMASLMKVAQKLNAGKWEVWFDAHGAQLTDDPTLNGTSYVIGVFR